MRGKISIEVLEPLATRHLIGRREIKRKLNNALESDTVSIVGITAPGGVGKSTLVRAWLESFNTQTQRQADIYIWQFTDVAQNTNASSYLFFLDALGLDGKSPLGGPVSDGKIDSEDGFLSEDRKAKLLLDKFFNSQGIMVLDQMEVLQYHEGAEHRRFYDEAIRRFLTGAVEKIEGHQNRLIVVTSRESLVDLEGMPGYQAISLEKLKDEEGGELLAELGVVGPPKELRSASWEYGGNALALVLLGRLIVSSPLSGRNISFRSQISPFFTKHQQENSKDWNHAKSVLDYYEAKVGKPEEIVLLKMMGLFHRPMLKPQRDHLLRHAGLTAEVRSLSESEWEACHLNLEKYGLLLPVSAKPRDQWDCHPLIREHFRDNLKQELPELWRQANQVLFEYFIGLPEETHPQTRKGLKPLYRAIAHGCLAEQYRAALRLYENRIMQGLAIAHGTNELGAISQDSAALCMFFQPGTTEFFPRVLEQLDIQRQAWLQARTAFCLTCLGRLGEAIEHREQELRYCGKQQANALPVHERQELLKNMANAAGKLSELLLLTGNLPKAEETARQAVQFADLSDDWGQAMRSRCRLAAVLHMHGELDAAADWFEQAVKQQQAHEPQRPALNSDHGFLYRNFLLDQMQTGDFNAYHALLVLAQTALDYDGRDLDHRWLVALGLGRMSKASSIARMAQFDPHQAEGAKALFNEAYRFLSDSGSVIYFPELFLEWARFQSWQQFKGQAIEDAKKALRYAMDYGMPLYQADAHLLLAELYLDIGDIDEAAGSLHAAQAIIQERGYGRRLKGLQNLQARLQS